MSQLSMPPLTQYELEELLAGVPPRLKEHMRRLLDEIRDLRDQASEREYHESQEREW